MAVYGSIVFDRLFCSILPVSMCSVDRPIERSRMVGMLLGLFSSLQSAGVGGTVSRLVPLPGGRLDRRGSVGAIPDDGLSEALFKLIDREDAGGGPGGGGGKGMLGSQVVGLGEWLAEREDPPRSPIAPVEAALRAAGARTEISAETFSGARASNWAVRSCKASIASIGDAALAFFPLKDNDESSRSAWCLEVGRARCEGGGGKDGPAEVLGESPEDDCCRRMVEGLAGFRESKSGDKVVAALTGVL